MSSPPPDAAGLSPDEIVAWQEQYEQVLDVLHASLARFDGQIDCAALLSALTTLLANESVRAEVPLDETLAHLRLAYQAVLEVQAARPVA